MEYEIDFLPVGEGEKSGDAICVRYSVDDGKTWLVGVIDGGTQESGDKIVEHVRQYYHTSDVDFLICTHPDQDHASGLSVVMDQLTVKKVLLHCPWDYIEQIWDAVNDGRVTKQSLRQKLIDRHPYAYSLYEKASEKNIPIYHPFSDIDDHNIPNLNIVGPSSNFYFNQLINFKSITDVTDNKLQEKGVFQELADVVGRAVNWLAEGWDDEHLVNPDENSTSYENNSSVISLFNFAGKKALLTGDAGVPALDNAADKIEELGQDLQDFSFVQIPHHGSKRNVGPTVLDKLLGSVGFFGQKTKFTAFVSASSGGEPKHPNKRVVNAFIRRGAKVIATQGSTKYHYSTGTPDRGWGKAQPLPFYERIENDD